MLNPQLKLPDCYKTQLKLNMSKCAPHTKKPWILVEMEVVIILRQHRVLVCAELHLQSLTAGSKGGFWLSRPRTVEKGEILDLCLLQTGVGEQLPPQTRAGLLRWIKGFGFLLCRGKQSKEEAERGNISSPTQDLQEFGALQPHLSAWQITPSFPRASPGLLSLPKGFSRLFLGSFYTL